MLKSPTKQRYRTGKELRFELSGNMNRYVWSLDNKVVSEADKILKKEECSIVQRFHAMRHPMHCMDTIFRVLNGQEEYAPLKTSSTLCQWKPIPLEFANVKR
jgi:FtsP/CotA-like multicopper oxidase with cupredoxin domain